ncbi:MAG: toll/interleukin-1 receptor domain-containing protein [Caldilineaceae bacterium]
MIQIFLSYARADGLDAATRLRTELAAMGFSAWRDIEEMRGGQAWKEQLRAALRAVDAVVVLLTPAAVASKTVEWEWENALTLGKRVLPVLIQPCDVPAELKQLHYHHLNTADSYTLGMARLVRDLIQVAAGAAKSAPTAPAAGAQYTVGKASHSAIGADATAVNVQAGTRASAAKLAQELANRQRSLAEGTEAASYHVEQAQESAIGTRATVFNVQSGRQASVANVLAQLQQLAASQPPTPAHAAELQQTLQAIAGQLGGLDTRLAMVEANILARFAQGEQNLLATIVARLNEQDALLTEAILDTVEIGTLTAAQLEDQLTAVQQSLALLGQQPVLSAPEQKTVQQVMERIEAPGLDVRHRLKVVIPLIPILLSYEGEYEFNIRANLEAVWQTLEGWVRESKQ